MGRANGKGYIEEMKERQLKEWNQRGGKPAKVLQWKDLPKQVKMEIPTKKKKPKKPKKA